MIATMTSGVGRPAEDSRSVATEPSSRKCSAGARVEIIIGASDWPNSWPMTGPIVQGLLQAAGRHRRRAVPQALQVSQVGPGQARVVEQHVDQRRRQERVGHRVLLDQRQELGQVRLGHDDDLAAERHDREAQHAGRVGQRGQGEVARARPERVAHQRQRRHRLDVAAGEHDALRPAGGTPGADEHDHVAGRLGLPGLGGSGPIHRSKGVACGGSPSRQTSRVSFGRSAGSWPPAARRRPGRSGTAVEEVE